MNDELPKKPKPIPEKLMLRPWVVFFALAYDGGGSEFVQWYRTKFGARISMFWKYHISSWGGHARIAHNIWPGEIPPREVWVHW